MVVMLGLSGQRRLMGSRLVELGLRLSVMTMWSEFDRDFCSRGIGDVWQSREALNVELKLLAIGAAAFPAVSCGVLWMICSRGSGWSRSIRRLMMGHLLVASQQMLGLAERRMRFYCRDRHHLRVMLHPMLLKRLMGGLLQERILAGS